jgi:hypothetical protein
MATRTTHTAVIVVAIATAAIAAYWHLSPYLAMSSMRSAAKSQDADAFNQYVDYPKLRESLKGQFAARMADVVGNRPSSNNDMANAGAAIGTALGMALADRMIDAMVRPEMVMKAMADAKLRSPTDKSQSGSEGQKQDTIEWVVKRKGVNRVVAFGKDKGSIDSESAKPVRFVFDREGFASWKLTEVRLPE